MQGCSGSTVDLTPRPLTKKLPLRPPQWRQEKRREEILERVRCVGQWPVLIGTVLLGGWYVHPARPPLSPSSQGLLNARLHRLITPLATAGRRHHRHHRPAATDLTDQVDPLVVYTLRCRGEPRARWVVDGTSSGSTLSECFIRIKRFSKHVILDNLRQNSCLNVSSFFYYIKCGLISDFLCH